MPSYMVARQLSATHVLNHATKNFTLYWPYSCYFGCFSHMYIYFVP